MLAKAPAVTSIEAQMLMRDAYESTYRIHNHATDNDPLALVKHYAAEDIDAFDPLQERLEAYNNAGVLKYTGTTFDVFMQYPRYRGDSIILACLKLMKKEVEAKEEAMRRLEEEKRKGQ